METSPRRHSMMMAQVPQAIRMVRPLGVEVIARHYFYPMREPILPPPALATASALTESRAHNAPVLFSSCKRCSRNPLKTAPYQTSQSPG